jgi:hypothetical protein
MIVRVVASVASPSRAVPPTTLIRRQSLNDPISCQHPTVYREVSADHECSHCSILLRQSVRLVGQIGLVLPSIDENEAGVSRTVPIGLVAGIVPIATAAKIWKLC